MPGDISVTSIVAILSLLFVASLSAIILKKIKFPYTIGLVIIGIVIGYISQQHDSLASIKHLHLTPHIILYILLPTLIFEASFNIDSRLLIKNITPVIVLAAPGLIIATVVTGFITLYLTPLTMGEAMVFGALISATDPVAVITLFKDIGAPKRLTMLVDGESLFNDATAIVAFKIVSSIFLTAATWNLFTFVKGAGEFCKIFFVGFLVGAVIGYIIIRIVAFAKDDPLIQVAFTTVGAYIAFIVADYYLEVSGVMSAMGAGMVLSWYGITRFTPQVKQYLEIFWSYAAFVANSFIFLLLGFSEENLLKDILKEEDLLLHVSYGILAVIIARLIVIYGLVPIVSRLPGQQKVAFGYKSILFWGGLRGAVPLALAFSLSVADPNLPHRNLIVEMTLGIVLFTLVFQGTTISLLLKFFKLNTPSLLERFTRIEALLDAKNKGLNQVHYIKSQHEFNEALIGQFIEDYEKEIKSIKKELKALRNSDEYTKKEMKKVMWTQAISICRQTYFQLFDDKVISESVLRELNLERMIEQDQVLDGCQPKLIMEAVPLEKRLEDFFLSLLCIVIPNDRFKHSYEKKKLSTKYEVYVALYVASNNVINAIKRLAKSCKAGEDIVDQCKAFYLKRSNEARDRINNLQKEYPTTLFTLEQETLHRIANSKGKAALHELTENGAITEAVQEKVASELS